MLELPGPLDNPVLMAAQLPAQVSRAMNKRKVNVLLSTPNLMNLPIHESNLKRRNSAMTLQPKIALRLQFLVRVVRKFKSTDLRLFNSLFTLEQIIQLEAPPDQPERVEAFVGRFGRQLC
jgi:hypothetical protein